MRDSHIITIEQLKAFAQLDHSFQFSVENKREKYRWIEECLRKFRYHGLKTKKEKSIACAYIRKVTSMSKAQLKRLIRQHKRGGKLIPGYAAMKRNGFQRKYRPEDIALFITTDAAHDHLSGEATRKIIQREYTVYHRTEYKTISEISVSHLYTIRNHNRQYNSSTAKWVKHTRAVQTNIGIRAKSRSDGRPGFLRVDTVHSGDLNGRKGAYHIDVVDEVTQWEMIATIEAISEYFFAPVIDELLRRFPFVIHEFHADNGSEYINHVVTELLTKLYIRLTKSRVRYSNDNALVESKNGSIIRKFYERSHIPGTHALFINEFNLHYVNVYLNYHTSLRIRRRIQRRTRQDQKAVHALDDAV